MLYTKVELFEDIQTIPEKCVKDTPEGEKARRDFRHKLKVLQAIFDMKLPTYIFKKDNMEKIKEAIELNIEGNGLLFGYTFFYHQILTSITHGTTCASKWTNM